MAHVVLIGKWLWHCTCASQEKSKELYLEWISQVVAELRRPQGSTSSYYSYEHGHVVLMDIWPWGCTSTGQDGSNELDLGWIGQVVAELQHLQGSKSTYYACGYAHVAPVGKWPWLYIYTDQRGSNEFDLELIHPMVAEFWRLQDSKSPYYKWTYRRTNRQPNGQRAFHSRLFSFKNYYIFINNTLSKYR